MAEALKEGDGMEVGRAFLWKILHLMEHPFGVALVLTSTEPPFDGALSLPSAMSLAFRWPSDILR